MSDFRLNKEQKSAVEYGKGPLLIVAGAGTGKTRVITERIKWLIENKKAKASEILALTFTEKAANEMLERVDTIMPLGYEEPWLSTFHSFADRILRDEALEIGLDPTYKIITDPQKWLLVRSNLFNFDLSYYRPLGNPTKFIDAMLLLFSRLQDEDVPASKFNRWAQNKKSKIKYRKYNSKFKIDKNEIPRRVELARAYEKYQEIKIKENKIDFGDLIVYLLRLFRERKNVLKKYQEQFKYILIDEFQDTNFAQFELIKLLCPPKENPNLMVVADDNQSIYRFRGAAVSNVLDFKKIYPEAKLVVLTKNYRNTQFILDAAYKLIKNNDPDTLEVKLGISKKLKAMNVQKTKPDRLSLQKPVGLAGGRVEILFEENGEGEAEAVIRKIIEVLGKETEYTYRDFAILARANNHLEPFVAALKRYGLPYQLVGNRGLFDQEEVKDLISFLRVCANPDDNISLFHFLHIPSFKIETPKIVKTLNGSKKKRISLWEEAQNDKDLSFAFNLIKKAQKVLMKEQVSQILYNFITRSDYLDEILRYETIENSLKLKNVNLFMEKVKLYESSLPAGGVSGNLIEFVEYLDMIIEAGENPAQAVIEDIDTINLLTVHSAKGLEFPVVFLVNLVSDRFPTRDRRDPIPIPDELIKETLPEGDFHIEEERRLFYVGSTRAKRYLFLTYAKNYGGKKEKRPSGFIEELGVKIPKADVKKEGGRLELLGLRPEARPIRKFSKEKLPVPQFISYSQLNYFKTCELKYKYKYVLGIPTPPHHALTFGQTIHNTLRDFHKMAEPKLQDLLDLYKKHFIQEGYDSPEHRIKRFEQGKRFLKKYFKVHKKRFGKPIHLEKKFRLKINNKPLIGVIDRVDKITNGYEIVDYKTGSAKDQKAVNKDEQLTIYALGAGRVLGVTPKKLSLYFIEEDKKVSTKRTGKEIQDMREEIAEKINEIEKSDFKAKPGFWCKFCEFSKICPWAFKES